MAEERGDGIPVGEDKVSLNKKRYQEYERESYQIFGARLDQFMTRSWDFDVRG